MKPNKPRKENLLEVFYNPPKSTEYPEEFLKLMEMILPRSEVVEIIKKEKQESNPRIEVNVPALDHFDDDPYIPTEDLDAFIDAHAELGAINVQLD